MAASHLPWPADNPADAKVRERRYRLFLDPEPEITTQPSRRDLPLMAHKSNATMLWPRRRNQPVPESSAVDKAFRALLLCAVKGGVSCHQTSYLRFSRFNRSLFFRLRFFITYLTLPFNQRNVCIYTSQFLKYLNDKGYFPIYSFIAIHFPSFLHFKKYFFFK